MIQGGQQTERRRCELEGNQRLALDGQAVGWFVESGSLAVFAVKQEHGRTSAQPRFLFQAGPGEVLLGVAPGSRTLMAVPAEAATLTELRHEECGVRELEDWVGKVGTVCRSITPPRPPARVDTILPADAIAAPAEGEIVWLRLVKGAVCLLGYEEARVNQPGTVFPLAPGMWCVAEGDAEVERARCSRASTDLLATVLFRAIEDLEEPQEEAIRSRFKERQHLNRQVTTEAMRNLASVSGMVEEAAESEASLCPILAAVQTVCRAEGIPVCLSPPKEGHRDPLQAIAHASGFRTRGVVLSGRWWRQQNGALLAYLADGNSPVALIPMKGRVFKPGYELYDPLQAIRTPVTRKVASALSPVAFVLYRPFGDKVGLRDLLRFGTAFYRRDLRVAAFCGLMTALLGLAAPQATALLVGRAIPDANRGLLLQLALAMAAASTGAMLFDLTQVISLLRAHTGTAVALQAGMWDRLLNLGPAFFRRFSTGDLRTRVEAITYIQHHLSLDLLRTVVVGLAAAVNLGLMFYYNAALAVIGLAAGVLVLASTSVAGTALARLEAAEQDLAGELSGLTVQLIHAVGKLRVAGAEERAFATWSKLYSRKQQIAMRIRLQRDRLHLINVTIPILASATAFWFVVGRNGSAAIPLGTFLAYNVALGTFLSGFTTMSDAASGLTGIPNYWRRARTILDVAPEIVAGKTHPGRLAGRVAFEHVSFRYRNAGPATLTDISLKAEPGECIALVGPSGSGKSTILNLLLRFETPLSGAIYLDGHDLAGLDIAAVRRQLGVVSQDSKLMSNSIFENIICGGLNTMEEAWEAARLAGMAEDIENMPMGMHTVISEGASNISGGQRQRLLIARALIRKPGILIFDEATSALDNRTQAIVTESLDRLRATRIVVAHRLSTVRHADRIYVIDAGRVVQQGAYDELAGQLGLFQQLMKRQMA